MNAALFRGDEAFRSLPRWLPLGVLGATLALGIATLARRSDGFALLDRPPWLAVMMAVVMWSAVAVFLLTPGCYSRCGELALALPLSSRSLWLAHLSAVLLSGILILAVTGGLVGGMLWLLARLPRGPVTGAPDLLAIGGDLLVVLVVTVVLQQSRDPHLSKIADRWQRDAGLLIASFALGAALAALPYYVALLPLGYASMIGLRTWRGLPPALALVPKPAADEPRRGGPMPAAAIAASDWRSPGEIGRRSPPLAGWRSLTLYVTLYRTLAKKPLLGAIAVLFLLMLGMILAGGLFDREEMRASHIAMTAYLLFAFTAPWFSRVYLVDHLPIDRRRLFAFIMLPSLALLLLGYAAGAWRASSLLQGRDLVDLRKEECCFHVHVPIGACEFARDGRPGANGSPWGESHDPWTVPLYSGGGAVLYSPYSTSEDSSLDFVALQISRAIEAVYDARIPAREIGERYLKIDGAGRVVPAGERLALRDAYPNLRPRRTHPELPFFLLPAVLLWLGMIAFYLRFFRPGWSGRSRKLVFGALLALAMAGHLVPFALAIGGFTQFPVWSGVLQIAARHFTAAIPGGAATVWIAAIALFAWSYLAARRRFMRLESAKLGDEPGSCWV